MVDGFLALWIICWPITTQKWGSTYMVQQSLIIIIYLVLTSKLRKFLSLLFVSCIFNLECQAFLRVASDTELRN